MVGGAAGPRSRRIHVGAPASGLAQGLRSRPFAMDPCLSGLSRHPVYRGVGSHGGALRGSRPPPRRSSDRTCLRTGPVFGWDVGSTCPPRGAVGVARCEVHLRVSERRRAAQPARVCGISSGIARAQQRQDRLKPGCPSGRAGGRRDRLSGRGWRPTELCTFGCAEPEWQRFFGAAVQVVGPSLRGWVGGGATTRPSGRVNGRQTDPGAERQRAVRQQSSDCNQQSSGCGSPCWRARRILRGSAAAWVSRARQSRETLPPQALGPREHFVGNASKWRADPDSARAQRVAGRNVIDPKAHGSIDPGAAATSRFGNGLHGGARP